MAEAVLQVLGDLTCIFLLVAEDDMVCGRLGSPKEFARLGTVLAAVAGGEHDRMLRVFMQGLVGLPERAVGETAIVLGPVGRKARLCGAISPPDRRSVPVLVGFRQPIGLCVEIFLKPVTARLAVHGEVSAGRGRQARRHRSTGRRRQAEFRPHSQDQHGLSVLHEQPWVFDQVAIVVADDRASGLTKLQHGQAVQGNAAAIGAHCRQVAGRNNPKRHYRLQVRPNFASLLAKELRWRAQGTPRRWFRNSVEALVAGIAVQQMKRFALGGTTGAHRDPR